MGWGLHADARGCGGAGVAGRTDAAGAQGTGCGESSLRTLPTSGGGARALGTRLGAWWAPGSSRAGAGAARQIRPFADVHGGVRLAPALPGPGGGGGARRAASPRARGRAPRDGGAPGWRLSVARPSRAQLLERRDQYFTRLSFTIEAMVRGSGHKVASPPPHWRLSTRRGARPRCADARAARVRRPWSSCTPWAGTSSFTSPAGPRRAPPRPGRCAARAALQPLPA